MIPLTERINLELRHRNPSEVTELILDTSKSEKIEGLTDDYVNLKELSLVNVGLKSLKGFPKLPNLTKLDLSDNRISGDLDCLKSCPNLNQLLLTSNRIRNINELTPLCNLPALEILDLCNCDVTKSENYILNVFQLLPQLIYLDGFDRNETEETDSDDYEESEFDDHNDDFHVASGKIGYASGKNGKYRPPTQLYQDGDEYVDDGDVCAYDDHCGTFETYNSHYYDHYNDEGDAGHEAQGGGGVLGDSDGSSDLDLYCPPIHGSKFVPSPAQMAPRYARKRSYSSEDEYESATKVFLHDGCNFTPSHD